VISPHDSIALYSIDIGPLMAARSAGAGETRSRLAAAAFQFQDRENVRPLTRKTLMKAKEIVNIRRKIAGPFRVTDGKGFHLKKIDPNDTLDFMKDEHRPMAKEGAGQGSGGAGRFTGQTVF
jgi:hypothetical protein